MEQPYVLFLSVDSAHLLERIRRVGPLSDVLTEL